MQSPLTCQSDTLHTPVLLMTVIRGPSQTFQGTLVGEYDSILNLVPNLPEPPAEEASTTFVSVSDSAFERCARPRRRVEVDDAEQAVWVKTTLI